MIRPVRTEYDFRWRRSSVAVLLFLCATSGALLAGAGVGGHEYAGDPLPVFPARVQAASEKIDPNTATAASLRRLGGIGPELARAIVEYRESHGPAAFRSADDLQKIPRIGPATVERIAPYLALPAK